MVKINREVYIPKDQVTGVGAADELDGEREVLDVEKAEGLVQLLCQPDSVSFVMQTLPLMVI